MWLTFHFRTISGRCIYFFLSTLCILRRAFVRKTWHYPDMVSLFAGTVLNQTGQAIETIAITMSVYLIISLSISLLMNIYNRRIALIER